MKISMVSLVGTMSFLFFSIVVGDLGLGYIPHPPPLPSHIVKMLIPSPLLRKNFNFDMLENESNPTSGLTNKHSNLNFGMLPKGDRVPPSGPSNKTSDGPPPPPHFLPHGF